MRRSSKTQSVGQNSLVEPCADVGERDDEALAKREAQVLPCLEVPPVANCPNEELLDPLAVANAVIRSVARAAHEPR
jgi:hypothetical protein